MASKKQKNPRVYDENSGREPDGKWKRGVSGNILGRPGGYQNFRDRLLWWLETKTIREIEELVDKKADWDDLCAIDGMVVRRIHAAVKTDGGVSDFTAILDRLLGKPPQAITGDDGKPLIPMMDMPEIARRAAFLLMTASGNMPLIIEQNAPGPADSVDKKPA